jgi:hypothetical protein
MSKRLQTTVRILPDGRTFTVRGRDAWALDELIEAGQRGCTPIDNPGPRWSAYVFKLKREYGLAIETRHERHRGSFPGTHARYVLVSQVEVLSCSDEQANRAA